jgi:hypothetical protein
MEISIIPKWLMSYLSKNYLIQYQMNILISNILIITIFVLLRNSLLDFLSYIPHFCLFDKLIGIECPVCGTTRAFCEIAKGNLQKALSLNLSSFFVALFFLFQIPLRLFSLYREKSIKRINLISRRLSYVVLAVIVANWLLNMTLR